MKRKLLMLALAFATLVSWSQDTTKALKASQKRAIFFSSTEPVELNLVSDFKRLKNKKQKKVFQPATITFKLPDQAAVSEEIQLAARGEFRRETCVMPSIYLDFKNPKAPALSYLRRLKLVCGCSSTSFDEELLLKEFLVYKIYNIITDLSFNVRLAKLSYKDVQNKTKEYSQYAFLIEDVDDLAKRQACREFTKPVRSGLATNLNQMTLVSMFQYMIGNTDWSLPNRHNVRFIQMTTDTFSHPYVVPYDFDYCGLVNAPYAIPQTEFGIEKVTDRYYRGFARAKEDVQPLVQLFKEKKDFIFATIQNFEPLSKKVRDRMVDYLKEFYEDLDNGRKVKNIFQEAVDHN